jgi:hypothetical protein
MSRMGVLPRYQRGRGVTNSGYGFPFGVMNVLKLIVKMVVQLCEYTKITELYTVHGGLYSM